MHIYEFLAHYNLYLKKFMAKINFLNILIRLYKDKPHKEKRQCNTDETVIILVHKRLQNLIAKAMKFLFGFCL